MNEQQTILAANIQNQMWGSFNTIINAFIQNDLLCVLMALIIILLIYKAVSVIVAVLWQVVHGEDPITTFYDHKGRITKVVGSGGSVEQEWEYDDENKIRKYWDRRK